MQTLGDLPVMRPPFVRLAALSALLIALAAHPAAVLHAGEREGEDVALLRRLADPGDEGHPRALAAWEERSRAEQIAFLRTRLASSDPDDAARAAAEIGGTWLSLTEMNRRMRLLRGRFEAAFAPPYSHWGVGGAATAGIPDVVLLFRDLAGRRVVPSRDVLEQIHRTAVPAHIPDLVRLLDRGDDVYFQSVFFTIANVANSDRQDRYRAWVARALDYGLDRILAERKFRPRPQLDPTPLPLGHGPGLPDAFMRIAKAAWGIEEGYEAPTGSLTGTVSVRAPWFWLHRWMNSLEPIDADGVFVANVARSKTAAAETRFWAMRHLVRLSPDWGGEIVEKAATGTDAVAVGAAAALALAGKPDAWRRLLALEDPPESLEALAWVVDPDVARERWLARLAKTDVLAGYEVPDLGPLARQELKRDWGVSPRTEDLTWIADHAQKGGVPPGNIAWYFARVMPTALTPAGAADVAHRMRTLPSEQGEDFALGNLDEVLGWLEVWNPEALKGLLSKWLTEVPEDARGQVLAWLAALGDTDHVDEMLASWPEWGDTMGLRAIGRVADPRIEPFLLHHLGRDDAEIAGEAFAALAIARGIPEQVFVNWMRSGSDEGDDSWAKAVSLMRSKDTVAAVLALQPNTGRLGLIDDARVDSLLRQLREDRSSGLYWSATAGLALRGEPSARAEMLGLVREGHTWLFDEFNDGVLLTCDRDPEFLAAWIGHVESNCCLGWVAQVVLREVFPTMPIRGKLGGATTSADIVAWLGANEGRFALSRIRQGWLPGPEHN